MQTAVSSACRVKDALELAGLDNMIETLGDYAGVPDDELREKLAEARSALIRVKELLDAVIFFSALSFAYLQADTIRECLKVAISL